MFDIKNWQPYSNWQRLRTVEMHTGGEPLRIFTEGLPNISGQTILEKRKYFSEHYDYIRTGTMWEPRGHADMYGAILTEPVRPDSDIGTFFMHNEGYSTMCGHAIIALTKFVLDTGLVRKKNNEPIVRFDAPPGQITAKAQLDKSGVVRSVRFTNVPCFVLESDQEIEVRGIGKVEYDIAFGGAFYAICKADVMDLKLEMNNHDQLVDYGRRIKLAIMEKSDISHPFEKDLGFLYGTIFTGKAHHDDHQSRNVCIFANGELDRSATGSGVSARAALHYAKGELQKGENITIESILDTTMDVKILSTASYGPYNAVIPEVGGSAYYTGKNEFWFDPDDPLKKGFIFR